MIVSLGDTLLELICHLDLANSTLIDTYMLKWRFGKNACSATWWLLSAKCQVVDYASLVPIKWRGNIWRRGVKWLFVTKHWFFQFRPWTSWATPVLWAIPGIIALQVLAAKNRLEIDWVLGVEISKKGMSLDTFINKKHWFFNFGHKPVEPHRSFGLFLIC